MFDLIAQVLAFFYSLVPSYGVAIVLLTLAVMIVVTPLTLKSTLDAADAATATRTQSDSGAVQGRSPEDERGVDGVLPGERHQSFGWMSAAPGAVARLPRPVPGCPRHHPARHRRRTCRGWAAGSASSGRTDVVQLNDDDLVFDPENLPVESDMYQDLIETNEMNFLGMDLSKTALDVVGENFLGALPYLALIVVVLVSSLVQQSRSEAATLARRSTLSRK